MGAPFAPFRLLQGCLVSLPAQLSVHFSNDYFDVGSDGAVRPTLINGGGGVLLQHPELREPVIYPIQDILISLSRTLNSLSPVINSAF